MVDDSTTNLTIASDILIDKYDIITVSSAEKLFKLLNKVLPLRPKSQWGALQAEIIPFEPDPDNAGEGNKKTRLHKFTPLLLFNLN